MKTEFLNRFLMRQVCVAVVHRGAEKLEQFCGVMFKTVDVEGFRGRVLVLPARGKTDQCRDLVSFWARFFSDEDIVGIELLLRPVLKESAQKVYANQERTDEKGLRWPVPFYDPLGFSFNLNAQGVAEIDEELKRKIDQEISVMMSLPGIADASEGKDSGGQEMQLSPGNLRELK